jgi:hypothetical protein
MDELFRAHVKAFLLAHQLGEDPEKNLAKIRVIANSNPEGWNGRLPTRGIAPDASYCTFAEATPRRPIVPWWWYKAEKEPVPTVAQAISDGLSFDFALVFQKARAWIYICVEPSRERMKLMQDQGLLKAFILMSLINKNFAPEQRETKRVRLAALKGSADIGRVHALVSFREEDPVYRSIPAGLPVLSRLVHPSSKTANWSIRLPGDRHIYGSFREIVPGL